MWGWVVNTTSRELYPPGKTRYLLYRMLGGPQGRSRRVQKISPLPGFDPRTDQVVASRYTDGAIPAHKMLYIIHIFFSHKFWCWTLFISAVIYTIWTRRSEAACTCMLRRQCCSRGAPTLCELCAPVHDPISSERLIGPQWIFVRWMLTAVPPHSLHIFANTTITRFQTRHQRWHLNATKIGTAFVNAPTHIHYFQFLK